jgi:hypothetical protein
MKKRSWIVFWLATFLAGLSGQTTAFGQDVVNNLSSKDTKATECSPPQWCQFTNAVYGIESTDTLTVGRLGHNSSESPQTFTLYDDGTWDLYDGTYHYTGTYALVKNGKQIALTINANGLAAVKSNLVDNIQNLAADKGVSLDNLLVTVQSVKITNITMKNGVPYQSTSTVKGNASATVNGKFYSVSFTQKSVKTNWTLDPGGN